MKRKSGQNPTPPASVAEKDPTGPPPAPSAATGDLAERLVRSYEGASIGHRIGRHALASRTEIIGIVQTLLELIYPGYYGQEELLPSSLHEHVTALLGALEHRLARQVQLSLCASLQCSDTDPVKMQATREKGRALALRFLDGIPGLRDVLLDDVRAALDGDPAALSHDEVILAYPGLLAVTVYRIAHALYTLEVPLIPRVMTEWAHSATGADIHPGATIGPRFFMDHATGIVIGQTSIIGADVKLYQGVTLGALSIPHDSNGEVVRGTKRHPTVEDDVTIYANATVLGGNTIIGAHSVIGGSVFVTKSVPAHSRVALSPPALRIGSIAPVVEGGWDWAI